MLRRRTVLQSTALLGPWGTIHAADDYPSHPVKLVLSHPAGGLPDAFGRAMAAALATRMGQQFVVENRAGGAQIIATDAVAKSRPDGYTLLQAGATSLALNVGAFKRLPYDPLKDFSPVSVCFYTPLYLIVGAEVPARSVKELIAYAKANPGKLSYASLGHGSSLHLAAAAFAQATGIDLLHVPYKGPPAALADVLSGRVSMLFDGGAFLPHTETGKMRVLAITSAQRLESRPNVPTMAESGVPGYDMEFWFGIVAPAGTPATIVDRLSREIAAIVRDPGFRERMRAYPDVRYVSTTPAAMGELIRTDIVKWTKLLRDAGVPPQET
jgi:tripartite-type tricarboxylate transporter receptor subunit TctC